MNKRDLKADLELCNKATPGPWIFGPIYKGTIADEMDEDKWRANRELLESFREGWPYAIERALKAESLARELAEVLRLYEQWEAELIMDNSLWQSASGLPFITQEVWDELVAIQAERNGVLQDAKEALNAD